MLQRLLFLAVTVGLTFVGRESLRAQEPEAPIEEAAAAPLFQETPFDEILLKEGSSVRVEPSSFPERRVPEAPKPSDKLVVRLVDKPGEDYELHWRDIERVRLFEQALLETAQEFATRGQMADAYEYFDYLERNYPKFPGVKDGVERLIYQDAQTFQRRKDYEYVLVLLNQLHARNPLYPGLPNALGIVTESLFSQRVTGQQFAAAQALLRDFAVKYPEHAVVGRLRDKLRSAANQYLAEARQNANAGKNRQALALCLRALDAWSESTEARDFAKQLYAKSPFVAVGVTAPVIDTLPSIENWSGRRAARLLELPLMEFTGFGAEGGQYVCPLGAFEKADLGLRVSFQLKPDLKWPGGAPVTSADIARTLRARDTGSDPLAGLIERLDTRDQSTIDILLKKAHVYPDALFAFPLLPPGTTNTTLGLYQFAERSPEETVFEPSAAQLPRDAQAPREVAERLYPSGAAALEGLARREVAVVDRLAPWLVGRARELPEIAVDRYAVPTVHCLIPNTAKPLMASRTFRRALIYGIHRQAILDTQILRGQEMPGARLASGPFPTGYGHNNDVEIRPYEPQVALMLMYVGLAEAGQPAQPPTALSAAEGPADPAQDAASNAPPDPASLAAAAQTCPPLVLAHPADDVAGLACRTIKRQLELIKVPVTLLELAPGETLPSAGDYDLLYAALQTEEPLVDVDRLLGPQGLVPLKSPYLRAALDRVASATDWKSAREALLDVHRIVADEVLLLPLYQLPEHFAYRKNLTGIGERPAALYQNILSWRTALELPPEE